MSARSKIRQFLTDEFRTMNTDLNFSDSDDLFQMGFVDSMFVLSLLGYLEKEFSFTIADKDISIKNFNSVDNILKMVNKYQPAPID